MTRDKDKEDNKDENNDQETQATLDADYNVDEFNLDEAAFRYRVR